MNTRTTPVAEGSEQASPFHAGEQELQARAGKRDTMEEFGKRVIRPYLTEQHREFFRQLPFLVVGSVDQDGWPWASLLAGRPGFISSPNETTVHIGATPIVGDALACASAPTAPLGILGIELASRRRNRMNGRVSQHDAAGITISVDQSFGNCPQYIQDRALTFIREPGNRSVVQKVGESSEKAREEFRELPADAQSLITNADTFFVASYVKPTNHPEVEGVDVSHRGGRPGFVLVEGNTLTIPDFPGNSHFNTLGNFLLNPKAGLVFPDFTTGDFLQLTGTVDLLSSDDPILQGFRGAERGWRVTVKRGVWLRDAWPLRFSEPRFSPNSLLADNWQAARERVASEARRDTWRSYRVARTDDESSIIRSIYLEPVDGDELIDYAAGQFLPIRVHPKDQAQPLIRTYTLSSAPADKLYRISVKRESAGVVSSHLHKHLKPGDLLEAKGPRGEFIIDPAETRPALLIAGGVGITPIISMARHLFHEAIRTRHIRPVRIFHAASSVEQRAFANTLRELASRSEGQISYRSIVSAPADTADSTVDYSGHLNTVMLRENLQLDDYDCFLCGPAGFVQAAYESLRALGIVDQRIFAEAFGPAALQRDNSAHSTADEAPAEAAEADTAVIKFVKSGFEQRWQHGDGTLLELAEQHGLEPEFSCRNGSCGTCATKLLAGQAVTRGFATAPTAADEILICSSVPGKGCSSLSIDL